MFIKANKCYHIVKQNTELLIKMIMQQRLKTSEAKSAKDPDRQFIPR